ncbi:MAG: Nif11-like leader peptide family natural product precursor [Aggregatilineales bacterium]
MALETALKFLERLEKEETLRTQLYISNPKTMDKLVEFVRGKGFVIRKEDLEIALGQYQEKFDTGSVKPLKQLLSGD